MRIKRIFFSIMSHTIYILNLNNSIIILRLIYLLPSWYYYRFFMSGYLALGYDLCIEYTYPESENISAGFLIITTCIYGIILIIIFGLVLNTYGDIPVHIGLCSILLLGFILTALTKDEQRRQDARRKAQYEGIATTEKNVDDVPETN